MRYLRKAVAAVMAVCFAVIGASCGKDQTNPENG